MTLNRLAQLIGLVAVISLPTVNRAVSKDVVDSSDRHPTRQTRMLPTKPKYSTAIQASSVSGTTPTSSEGRNRLQMAVDGSQGSAAIPDAIAYRLFFKTTLVSDGAGTEDLRRQQLRLSNVGLTDIDQMTYLLTMQVVQENLERIAEQRGIWSVPGASRTTTGAMLKLLKEQETQAFHEAQQRLHTQLTAEGRERLESYIRDHVKPKVKMYSSVAH